MNKNTPSSFSREKAIKALTSLELSLGEAKIYTWLVGEGPTHASTIASEADVLQPKVYGYLKDLVKRTFVIRQEKEGTPDTFTAVPYEIVMETLENEIYTKIKVANNYFKNVKEKEKERQVEDLFSYYEGKKTVFAGLKTVVDKVQKNIIIVTVNRIDEELIFRLFNVRRKENPRIEILRLTTNEKILKIPPIKKLMSTEGFSGLLAKRPTMFYTDVDFEKKSCSSMNMLLPPIDDFSSVLINIKHPVALHFQVQLFDGFLEMLEKQGMTLKEL